jgi:hypothetical protein
MCVPSALCYRFDPGRMPDSRCTVTRSAVRRGPRRPAARRRPPVVPPCLRKINSNFTLISHFGVRCRARFPFSALGVRMQAVYTRSGLPSVAASLAPRKNTIDHIVKRYAGTAGNRSRRPKMQETRRLPRCSDVPRSTAAAPVSCPGGAGPSESRPRRARRAARRDAHVPPRHRLRRQTQRQLCCARTLATARRATHPDHVS